MSRVWRLLITIYRDWKLYKVQSLLLALSSTSIFDAIFVEIVTLQGANCYGYQPYLQHKPTKNTT